MHFIVIFIVKTAINTTLLYGASRFFVDFSLVGGLESIVIAALVVTALNTFIKPLIKIIATPLIWITFGLFLLALNMFILGFADYLLPTLTIGSIGTLFWTSLAIAIVNGIL